MLTCLSLFAIVLFCLLDFACPKQRPLEWRFTHWISSQTAERFASTVGILLDKRSLVASEMDISKSFLYLGDAIFVCESIYVMCDSFILIFTWTWTHVMICCT